MLRGVKTPYLGRNLMGKQGQSKRWGFRRVPEQESWRMKAIEEPKGTEYVEADEDVEPQQDINADAQDNSRNSFDKVDFTNDVKAEEADELEEAVDEEADEDDFIKTKKRFERPFKEEKQQATRTKQEVSTKRSYPGSDNNESKKLPVLYSSEEKEEESAMVDFEKMVSEIISDIKNGSGTFDRYSFHQYINKNLYDAEFKTRNQLLNAFHIWNNRYDTEHINETMQRLMLGRLGYCYVLRNNILYCRVHSMLKFSEYFIPFAYISRLDNRIRYKNYERFRELLQFIYYEYDDAREHKLENHNVIGLIHTLLYPRHCHLYVRLGWLTKLVYNYIKSPEEYDDSLFEITVTTEPVYVFEKMRSVEAQQMVVDKLHGHFKWMYPKFDKSDESIRKFIYYYYTEMCGKATVKAPFLQNRF